MESMIVWGVIFIASSLILRFYLKQANAQALWKLGSITSKPVVQPVVLGVSVILFLVGGFTLNWWLFLVVYLMWVPIVARRWLIKRTLELPETAVEYLPYFIEQDPTNFKYHYVHARAYLKLRNYEAALQEYDTLADLMAQRKEKKLNFKTGISDLPMSRAFLHNDVALAYWYAGEYKSSVTECDAGLAIPNVPHGLKGFLMLNRASAMLELGQVDKALEDYKAVETIIFDAINTDSTPSNVMLNQGLPPHLALVYYKLGDMDKAIEYWQKTVSRDKNYGDSNWLQSDLESKISWRLDAMLDLNERLKALS